MPYNQIKQIIVNRIICVWYELNINININGEIDMIRFYQ